MPLFLITLLVCDADSKDPPRILRPFSNPSFKAERVTTFPDLPDSLIRRMIHLQFNDDRIVALHIGIKDKIHVSHTGPVLPLDTVMIARLQINQIQDCGKLRFIIIRDKRAFRIMDKLQDLLHRIRISGLRCRQHTSRLSGQPVYISKRRFFLNHFSKFIHQLLVWNGNAAVFIIQESINHHCGKYLIPRFQFH